MVTDVLTLPGKRRLPLWGLGLGLLIVMSWNTTLYDANGLVKDARTTAETTQNWETQGASNCTDSDGDYDAFIPGMRGSGACTRGGFQTNTTVISVTNTNASGAGSLDAAASAACPKVIIFDVAGVINVNGAIEMNNCDEWSIVGASAPGNVTITNAGGQSHLFRTDGSHWTVDHLTFAAAGNSGTGDSAFVGNYTGSPDSYGIFLNNNMIWGTDEVVSCSSTWANTQSKILLWQNYIGVMIGTGGFGLALYQNMCTEVNSIRNVYMDSYERMPLTRGDGYFHANNLSNNAVHMVVQATPCTDIVSPVESPVRMSFMYNYNAKGLSSQNAQRFMDNRGGTACTTVQIYEEGTQVSENTGGTIYDCSSHACTGGYYSFDSGVWESSQITAIYPTGYVPETITNTRASLTSFAGMLEDHVGAFPASDRFTYIQTKLDEAVASVTGTGTESDYIGLDASATVANEGGLTVVTDSGSWDASAQCPTHAGNPDDGTPNAISSSGSGLTNLHEWVIECFYDTAMPDGYREALD